MIVPLTEWRRIRGQFSEEEKAALHAVVTGATVHGPMLDEYRLTIELREKLKRALKGEAAHGAGNP